MPHATTTVVVDVQLHWVVRVPEGLAGTTRAPSAAQLTRLGTELEALQVTADDGERADALLGAIPAVIEILGELPDLPFIGEPFGGEGGTD